MNNIKRFICYVTYVMVFWYILVKADDYQRYLKHLYASTYDLTYHSIFISIFPILIGILIVLPQFIKTFKKPGTWKVDLIFFLTVGLPSLCIAITPIIFLAQFARKWSYAAFILGFHPNLVTVAGIVFGYVLLSSFGKQKS